MNQSSNRRGQNEENNGSSAILQETSSTQQLGQQGETDDEDRPDTRPPGLISRIFRFICISNLWTSLKGSIRNTFTRRMNNEPAGEAGEASKSSKGKKGGKAGKGGKAAKAGKGSKSSKTPKAGNVTQLAAGSKKTKVKYDVDQHEGQLDLTMGSKVPASRTLGIPLPAELFLMMVHHLDQPALVAAMRVNKEWHRCIEPLLYASICHPCPPDHPDCFSKVPLRTVLGRFTVAYNLKCLYLELERRKEELKSGLVRNLYILPLPHASSDDKIWAGRCGALPGIDNVGLCVSYADCLPLLSRAAGPESDEQPQANPEVDGQRENSAGVSSPSRGLAGRACAITHAEVHVPMLHLSNDVDRNCIRLIGHVFRVPELQRVTIWGFDSARAWALEWPHVYTDQDLDELMEIAQLEADSGSNVSELAFRGPLPFAAIVMGVVMSLPKLRRLHIPMWGICPAGGNFFDFSARYLLGAISDLTTRGSRWAFSMAIESLSIEDSERRARWTHVPAPGQVDFTKICLLSFTGLRELFLPIHIVSAGNQWSIAGVMPNALPRGLQLLTVEFVADRPTVSKVRLLTQWLKSLRELVTSRTLRVSHLTWNFRDESDGFWQDELSVQAAFFALQSVLALKILFTDTAFSSALDAQVVRKFVEVHKNLQRVQPRQPRQPIGFVTDVDGEYDEARRTVTQSKISTE